MKRLFCLFKYGRLGVHEILKVAILVRLKSLTDIAAFAIDHLAHSISQGTLTINQRLHQLRMSRWRGGVAEGSDSHYHDPNQNEGFEPSAKYIASEY
jgi:hypothetical protein